MDEYKEEVAQEKHLKPKLYTYPDLDSPVAVFDFDDLEEPEAMLVLCVRKAQDEEYREEETCYVWKGPDFSANDFQSSTDMDDNAFVQKCVEHYWGGDPNFDTSQVKI